MSDWISVKERLPAPKKFVWVYWRDREVLLAEHWPEQSEGDPAWGWYSFEDEKIKWANWWMPIKKPEPPERLS